MHSQSMDQLRLCHIHQNSTEKMLHCTVAGVNYLNIVQKISKGLIMNVSRAKR